MASNSKLERFDPDELIAEKDVPKRWKGLFSPTELANLRKEGKIGHLYITRQRVFYRPVDIEKYLQDHFVPPAAKDLEECPSRNHVSSSTRANGSEKKQEDPASIDSGSTAETLAAASLLLQS